MNEIHNHNQNQEPFLLIFLAGPPGAGKTSLGRSVCDTLGLRFFDLSGDAPSDVAQQQAAFDQLLADRTADVVELPWELQLRDGIFKKCREAGRTIALWAHPLDMQRRSDRSEPLFTPALGRVTRQGGFGLRGTSCREFRRIDRACESTLMLVGMSLDEARQALQDTLARLTLPPSGSTAEQEGIAHWAVEWQAEYRADPQATEVLVDAMARFVRDLKKQGKSPRTLHGVYSNLQALGMLNFSYDQPTGEDVLAALSAWQYEFDRKFACSEGESQRYLRTYRQFCKFLNEQHQT